MEWNKRRARSRESGFLGAVSSVFALMPHLHETVARIISTAPLRLVAKRER